MKKNLIFLLALFFFILQPLRVSAYQSEPSAGAIPLNVKFKTIATGIANPVFVTHAGDSSGRIFIVQKEGKILIYKDNALLATPFLNISALLANSGEQGLLGLAFHPDYETNRKFYVYYTNLSGDIEIVQYLASISNADRANASSAQRILTIDKPGYTNHNGGWIGFGADGYLYAAVGDGGGGGDPNGNGQNTNSLLGKILRIDVNTDDFPADANKNYGIPLDNPFVGIPGADEIWAYGLRNPWRASFDRATNDLYIADVGQAAREEINFQPADSAGGENYGWNVMEGSLCYNPSSGCDTSGKVLPVAEYSHAAGCAVTGGYVYRGAQFPALQGVYLYMDFCEGTLYGLANINDSWVKRKISDTNYRPTSFGEDENGELYITDYATSSVKKIVPAAVKTATFYSQRDNDGWVVEIGENAGFGGAANASQYLLLLGDDAQNRQYRSIMSFDTGSLPDSAVVISVTLKMRHAGTAGAENPFSIFEGLFFDVRKNTFGLPGVEITDFQNKANRRLGPFAPVPQSNWHTVNLFNARDLINTTGMTQIRLRFKIDDNNNLETNALRIYSGNAPSSYVPRLIVRYYIP